MKIAGVNLTWQMLVAAAALLQWAAVAVIAIVAPVRMRKALAVSTALFAAGWLFAFQFASMIASKENATQASVMTTSATRTGSCASIQNDMTGNQVRNRLGQPDETRSDDVIRGPGSTVLIYRDMRCAVHLLDDRVELVD
jgi:hypothetical protein